MSSDRRYTPLGKTSLLEARVIALEGVGGTPPPVNNAPVWDTTPSVSWAASGGGTYDLAQDVTDADGDQLTFSLAVGSTALPAEVTLDEDGTLTATSSVGAATTTGIFFDVTDGEDTTTSSSVTITVTASPVWTSTPAPTFEHGTGSTYDLSQDVSGVTPIAITLNVGGASYDNELLWTEAFDNAAWNATNGAITTGATTAPADTTVADELIIDNAGGSAQCYVRQLLTLSLSTQYTVSVYAKKSVKDWLNISLDTWSTPANSKQYFDLTNGVIGTLDSNLDAADISDAGGGWYRCELTFTTGGADPTGWIQLGIADADADRSVSRNGSNSIYLSGAQCTEGVEPKDYVKSEGTKGSGSGGGGLPTGVTYSDPTFTYDGTGIVGTTTGIIATATDDNSDTALTDSFPIIIEDTTVVTPSGSWPGNAWFLTGGYQISNAFQLVDSPDKEYNGEKDINIAQGGGPYPTKNSTYTGYYKSLKTFNPDIKLITYQSPAVVRKVEFYNPPSASAVDWIYELVNGQDGTTQWYLRDSDGNQVQAGWSVEYSRMNWAQQFLDDNGKSQNYGEAYIQGFFDVHTTPNTNGRMIDFIDGVYWDVVPMLPQRVWQYGVSPRVADNQDFNNNSSADSTSDETDGSGTEANYGGCRMYRRGVKLCKEAYKTIYGSSMALGRNASKDGSEFNASNGSLGSSTHAMTANEFYQIWDFGVSESMPGKIGCYKDNTNLNYELRFNQFGVFGRYMARTKASLVAEGSHIWGKYGAHLILNQFQMLDPADLPGGVWRTEDYNVARFITAVCRLTGTCTAINIDNRYPFPNLDEDVFPCGDTVSTNPPTLGTYDPATAVNGTDADFTLRSPDYETGIGDFYWEQFDTLAATEKYIWVLRSDWPGGTVHGDGIALACQLPDPGVGKKWVHVDVRSTVLNGIRTTRAQDTTLNNGGDVDAGGSYGAVDLLPAHAVMLVTADS